MSSSRFYLSSMMGVLLLAAAGQVAAVPYILPVCKSIGGGSSFFDVQLCLEALGSDQRTFDADMTYRNFSVVAADLLTANATSTAAKIDALLREGGGGATARCLRSCQALYGGIVQRQPGCAAAIKELRDEEAISSLEKSASAAKECEAGFRRSSEASPVAAENVNAFKLAKIAVALIKGADGQ